MSAKSPVIFLDRDGTLIHDRPGFYLRRPEQLRFYRHTFAALRLLKQAGYRLVVVSNQSGVGRGYLTLKMLAKIHAKFLAALKSRGAAVDGIYFCPHHPERRCSCRKPSPLLARKAIKELGLSLAGAAVIGDKKADIELAANLGIPGVFLRTGHGRRRPKFSKKAMPAHEAGGILPAARWILRNLAPAALAAVLPLSASAAVISSRTVASPADLVAALAELPAGAARFSWYPESLQFEVKWGIFAMGTATLEMKEAVSFNGTPAYRIVSQANSGSFADKFYKVRDINESWLDAVALNSLGYSKKLREGEFFRDEWVLYDYPRKTFLAKRVNRDASFEYSSGPVPGPVQDILSSLYYIRPKKLSVGDVVTLDVNTKSNWPLAIKVLKKQTVTVPAGKFRCIVVEPFIREEGIFIQKGKTLQLWLTDDERHMPVLMKVEIIFGSISAYLTRRSP